MKYTMKYISPAIVFIPLTFKYLHDAKHTTFSYLFMVLFLSR
jgi:hypothetical protein